MKDLILKFRVKGTPCGCLRYGCGHINETYLVTCNSGLNYILQKINKTVFSDPLGLMENISAVTGFLEERSDDPRSSMHVIPTVGGESCYRDEEGEYWRMYAFVVSSLSLQKAESPEDFYNSGLAFGRFQRQLAEFSAQTLHEPIRDFHNTRARFAQLHAAMEKAEPERIAACRKELEFALAREEEAGLIVDALADGRIPLRVTHNDTKLNNILFDYDTRQPLCVIDLDTIMPGSSLYDYGDAIRFGASTAAEDEKDLDKVWCDMELFRTYTEGFLTGCGDSLTDEEVNMLPVGAKMMTLECGTRFLADFLNGDVYFRTHYEGQNLDRARTQLKLVADMEDKWETMSQIVRQTKSAFCAPVK